MGRTCLAARHSSLWSAKTEIWHRVTSGENCCLQLVMGDSRALGWQCSHRRVSTTGWEEVVLGSSSVALNSATYLSFLKGLLGQQGLLPNIVRGWWDGNWDGSRSEKKH